MSNEEEYYDVAISGISGKFPSCDNLEELKQKLLDKVNLVMQENCRWNPGEWNVPAATGQISVVKKFDDTFFGVHSGVAGMMDPLTRVAIERAYEAIMDAGINPKNLRGSRVAVYTNSCISDSEAVGCDEKLTAKFWLLAHVRALLANRISYVLHLQGPSYTLDSTWVGGVECLKHAVHDIKIGRIESALVGVSNVILYPDLSLHWMGLEKLSPDGTCNPFQEDANGYGRSEGVVFLYLQRANDANRIYATVSHVDTTFCGDKSKTFLKPKEEAFVEFFRKFYTDYPISFDDIAYLEADGCAHKYYDEIELNSIGAVICNGRKESLPVGCVKSNLGHTEGSSSLVSLAKTLICLDSGVIPPNLDFKNPNKNIEKLQTNDMKIVTNAMKFPEGKFAALNTIGLTTSVGHVLMKPHSKEKKMILDRHQQIPRLVLVSARHEPGILNIIDKLESMPYDPEYFSMVNDVFKDSSIGHFYRGFTILGATEKKIHFTLESIESNKRPVWFVFAGMGSQWPGMGADLMHLPVFANTIRELDSYLKPLGVDLIDIITNFDPTVLKNIVHCFVGISAIQIGMVDVLRAVGIEPDGMIGHSLGENGCAYTDGCFTKYQAIMAAYFRGKASSQTEVPKGLMAAVGLGHTHLPDLPENVQIACHNSEDSTTISGPFDQVQGYMEELKRRGVFVRAVNSNFVAYHSNQVKPLAPYVLENVKKVVPHPKKRSSRWISTSVLEKNWNSPAAQYSSAEYHVNNFLGTVYFAEACKHIPEEAIVIEISPHGLFQGILKRSTPESCVCIPLGKREISSPLNFLLSAIGKLYVVGLRPDVNAIYPPVEYPVSRGTPSLATLATWNYDNEWELNNYKDNSKIKPTEISLRSHNWRFLTGYKIRNKILVPFPLLLVETRKAYESNEPILIFENVNIENNVEVNTNNNISIHTQVHYGSGNFEITDNKTVLINGNLHYSQENLSAEENSCENDFNDCITFTRNEIQEIFKQNSMEFSAPFSRISEIMVTDDGCRATLIWDDNLAFFLTTVVHVRMFYDLCTAKKGPLFPKSFLRLAIEVEKYATMQSGAAINIVYSKSTDIIKGPGIELVALINTCESFSSDNSRLILQDLQFVANENPQTKSVENFFNLCGQIIGESFYTEIDHEKGDNPTSVNVIVANDLSTEKTKVEILLEMLYRELPPSQIDLMLYNAKYSKNGGKNSIKYNKCFIVCKNVESIVDALPELIESIEDIFLLTFENVQKIPSQFTKITEEHFGNFNCTLWKKKEPVDECLLKIMPYQEPHWLDDLEEELYGITAKKSVVLQWDSKYIVDVVDVINQINALAPVHSLRYLVIMEDKIPDYAENSRFYKDQLQKGLKMNVFKNGTWGSIRHLSAASTLSISSDIHRFAMKTKRMRNIDVEYISLHESDSTLCSFNDEIFEFSGITSDKRKVMGIATTSGNLHSHAEPVFCWYLPEKWSLEDAVTLPMAYVKAYYALFVKGKLSSSSKILVHSGHTVLGEACIAVALSMDCEVYTSADTEEQANYIKQRFPKSNHLYVFMTNDEHIDVKVLQSTHGKGVDIIVNAENEKQIKQSTDCLSSYGTFVQIAERSIKKNIEIGMRIFASSATAHSLTNLSLFKNHPEIKKEIQALVQEALKHDTFVLRPFRRTLHKSIEESQINRALRENDNSRSVVIKQISNLNTNESVFLCDPDKYYLIIGKKNEIWFSVISWLLENNARKLVLIEDDSPDNDYNVYQKRFNLLIENHPDLSLMRSSSSLLNSKEEAINTIRTINSAAPLDVIFCISLNSEEVTNINAGLLKCAPHLRQLICLQCDASKVCETRHQSGLPALNIIWDRGIREATILMKCITGIVNNCLKMNSPLIYIADSVQFTAKLDHSKVKKIGEILPKYSEAEYFKEVFSESPAFEKIVSKVSEYDARTQLFPMFFIPGLHFKKLEALVKKLMYPVFCAKISPKYSSAKSIAQSLIKALKEIQPTGPYTIIGESWGGAVAMELTSLLEQNHQDLVRLILIEGIPKDLQDRLSMLGSFGSREFLDNLCEICFGNKISKAASFEDGKLMVDNEQMKYLELLQRRLTTVFHYSPTNVNLKSHVIAIKLEDNDVLNTYVNFEEHYGQYLDLEIIAEENYDNLINSKTLATLMNDNVLFKW